MKSVKYVLLTGWICLIVSSCSKQPGKGGLATIKGKIYGYDINSSGIIHDSGYVGNIKVFISYGNNEWTDDTELSSYTGDYAFEGLQTGHYKLFVFYECDSCLFNQYYMIQETDIEETSQIITLPDFIVYE